MPPSRKTSSGDPPGGPATSGEHARPLISVVIPTYNRARYLREALESALEQTYAPLEIVVMDDASPDNTEAVVGSFDAKRKAGKRLVYHRHDTNLGPNANWRAGIAAASGQFFCILADDDVLRPDFVECLAAPLFRDDDLVFSFCDHWIIDRTGAHQRDVSDRATREYGRSALGEGRLRDPVQTALVDEGVYIGAALFRRSLVGPEALAEQARSAIGGWLFYQSLKTGCGVYYVPERQMSCRWFDGSVSRSQRWRPSIVAGNLNRYRRMAHDAQFSAYRDAFVEKQAHEQAAQARFLLSTGHPREARRAAARSLAQRKSYRAAGIYALACLGPVGVRGVALIRQLQFSR